ncbi:MAG TPA: hypothetical protein VJO72_11750, partial [Candidatus Dormibacteraeota bacterium]|nr:hypothetical protein [Candidatus Dormibacteraeota bacterium]
NGVDGDLLRGFWSAGVAGIARRPGTYSRQPPFHLVGGGGALVPGRVEVRYGLGLLGGLKRPELG